MPPAGLKSALFSDSGVSDQSRIQSLMEDIFRHAEDRTNTLDDRVSGLSQVLYLMYLARARKASSIAEIGFSIGFSSIAFLESSPAVQVTSFEIHNEAPAKSAKEFIDSRYPPGSSGESAQRPHGTRRSETTSSPRSSTCPTRSPSAEFTGRPSVRGQSDNSSKRTIVTPAPKC